MKKKLLIGLVAIYGAYLAGSSAMAAVKLQEVRNTQSTILSCVDQMTASNSMDCAAISTK